MAELSGDLSVMPLSDAVIWIANRRKNGTLGVERDGVTKSFDIVDGQATRAASNDPREYFGQFLVHSGLLTEDQLQRAFQTQNETKVLLGRILVMIGIVPEEQVIQALRVKVSESLLDAFRWKTGRFRFEEGDSEDERPHIDLAVDLVDIHTEGLARSEMWARYNRVFPDSRWVLHVNDDAPASRAPPDTLPGRILSLARHGLSIEAITLDLHATDYQLASRLLELHRGGAIVPQEPSNTLLPISSRSIKAHVDKARAALEADQFSVAFSHVENAARTPGHEDAVDAVREELKAKVGEGPQELSRSAIPTLVTSPNPSDLKRLSAKQRYVLARIDGERSVDSIIQVSPMHDGEALEILRQFEADRLIELK